MYWFLLFFYCTDATAAVASGYYSNWKICKKPAPSVCDRFVTVRCLVTDIGSLCLCILQHHHYANIFINTSTLVLINKIPRMCMRAFLQRKTVALINCWIVHFRIWIRNHYLSSAMPREARAIVAFRFFTARYRNITITIVHFNGDFFFQSAPMTNDNMQKYIIISSSQRTISRACLFCVAFVKFNEHWLLFVDWKCDFFFQNKEQLKLWYYRSVYALGNPYLIKQKRVYSKTSDNAHSTCNNSIKNFALADAISVTQVWCNVAFDSLLFSLSDRSANKCKTQFLSVLSNSNLSASIFGSTVEVT